jgi:uracil-DNA glycosylase
MVSVCVCAKGRRRSQVRRTAETIEQCERFLSQKFDMAPTDVKIASMSGRTQWESERNTTIVGIEEVKKRF